MAVALFTHLSAVATYQIGAEREARPSLPQTCLIDPDKVITASVGPTKLHQGREMTDGRILSLHETYEQVVGLLTNSEYFETVLGLNQVLDIGPLRRAVQVFPKQPIALDLFTPQPPNKIPPLLLIGVRQSPAYQLPMVVVEFCPQPRWVPSATANRPHLLLKEPQVLFHTTPSMPPGLGFLNTRYPSGVLTLLSYQESEQFQISEAAVGVIDTYLERLDLATVQFRPPS
jgi:hypothetical protein